MNKETPIFKFALREDLKNEKQFLPTKAEPKATGYDVRAAQLDRKDIVLRPGSYFRIPLGFRCFCEPGWYYELHPRSSSFIKKSMNCLVGIVDETFNLEATLIGVYWPDISLMGKDLVIKFGDRIGQLIPRQYHDIYVEQISNEQYDEMHKARNSQRKGGYGSTGER